MVCLVQRCPCRGLMPAAFRRLAIYNLRLRLSQIQSRAVNVRSHTDEDVKDRMLELRARGHTHAQVASILNELGFLPLKGRRFTERSVRKLFGRCRQTKVLSPRRFLEAMLERMRREHEAVEPDAPFERPGFPTLAKVLGDAGYVTPKGRAHWWPAQVQQLLEGRFDKYYSRAARSEIAHSE